MSAPTIIRAPMKVATVRDVKRAVRDMDDAYLRCRDMGHNWRQARVEKVGRGYERTLYCSSCKTNRHQTLNRYGVVETNHYSYADGYQIKGLGRVNGDAKSALRLASLQNAIDHSSRHADDDQ